MEMEMKKEMNKEIFLQQMDQKLKEWDECFNDLKSKVDGENEWVAQEEMKRQINLLKRRENEARRLLDRMKGIQVCAWTEAAKSVSVAYNDMKNAYQTICTRVSMT